MCRIKGICFHFFIYIRKSAAIFIPRLFFSPCFLPPSYCILHFFISQCIMTTSKDFISTGDGVFFRHSNLSLFILCFSCLFLPSCLFIRCIFFPPVTTTKTAKKKTVILDIVYLLLKKKKGAQSWPVLTIL